MNVSIIYGNMRRGSTYNVVNVLLNKLKRYEEVEATEFFLPKDMPQFCLGCFNCFLKSEEKCPHYNEVRRITDALDLSDLIIIASPVYVYDVTGQLKTLLDHLGHQWLPHRPKESMFNKTAVAISTTAGSGLKHTLKTIEQNFQFWGIGKIYKYGVAVRASNWTDVKEDIRNRVDKDTEKLAKKIFRTYSKANSKPSLKVRLFFYIFKKLHQKNIMTEVDRMYWEKKGWLNKKRPY